MVMLKCRQSTFEGMGGRGSCAQMDSGPPSGTSHRRLTLGTPDLLQGMWWGF